MVCFKYSNELMILTMFSETEKGYTRRLNHLSQRSRSFDKHRVASQITAQSSRIFAGGCYGDSGGPLACQPPGQRGKRLLVGLASYSQSNSFFRNCAAGFPDVYTRVANYTDFFTATGPSVVLSGGELCEDYHYTVTIHIPCDYARTNSVYEV